MSDYFPREILVDIFLRLHLKSIVTCTCVCKTWKALITQNAFITDHLNHTIQSNHGNDDGSLFLQLYGKKRKVKNASYRYEGSYSLYSNHNKHQIYSLSPLKFQHISGPVPWEHSRVVGTCNGLVCIVHYYALHSAVVVILNPSIRKFVVIPEPSDTIKERRGILFGFGYDCKKQDFKLVRLVSVGSEQHNILEAEVYSLASRSWRKIIARPPPFETFVTSFWNLNTPQVFLNGVVHWVKHKRVDKYTSHNFILTFDVVEESFGELMVPQEVKVADLEVSILVSENLLAVTHKNYPLGGRESTHIWVMKEYGVVESWTMVFHSDSKHFGGIMRVLALRSSGQVVLINWKGSILLVDSMEVVKKLRPKGYYCSSVVCYVESLFLINKETDILSY